MLFRSIVRSRLPFEEWIVRYKQDWQSGCYEAMGIGVAESEKGKCFAFVPRLRRAQVRFSQNGPMETVLAYTLYADYEKRCLEGPVRSSSSPPALQAQVDTVRPSRRCASGRPSR